MECLICLDNLEYFQLGQCNHRMICYKCSIKLRILQKNNKCSYCNTVLPEVIITSVHNKNLKFIDFNPMNLQIYKKGILYDSPDIKHILDELYQIKCQIQTCSKKEKVFNNVGAYQKHLTENHNRMICEVCISSKTETVKEYKIYSKQQFKRHMNKGDFDNDNNLILFHPYCQFCNKYFYQESDLKLHLQNSHFNCHICKQIMAENNNQDFKYMYYQSYDSLQHHFRLSHYLCQDKYCLQDTFVVFQTKQQLEIHQQKVHLKMNVNKQMNSSQYQNMVGFIYSDQQEVHQKTVFKIRDKHGVDFKQQFALSLQENVIQDQEIVDGQIDFRDFQKVNKEHYIQTVREIAENNKNKVIFNSKLQYMSIVQLDKIYLEDLDPMRYQQFDYLDDNQIYQLLQEFSNKQQIDMFNMSLNQYLNNLIDQNLFFNFILTNFDKVLALYLVPILINLIYDSEKQTRLDQIYVNNINRLVRKEKWLISSSGSYLGLFQKMVGLLEQEMVLRVLNGRVDLKQKTSLQKQQLIQYIQILKKNTTVQMGQLRFIVNFGIKLELMKYIKEEVYFQTDYYKNQQWTQFDNEQLVKTYIYMVICINLIKQTVIGNELGFSCVNVYFKVVQQNREFQKLYDYKQECELVHAINIYARNTQFNSLQSNKVIQYNVRKQNNKPKKKKIQSCVEDDPDSDYEQHVVRDIEENFNLNEKQRQQIKNEQNQMINAIEKNKKQQDPFDFPDLEGGDNMDSQMKKIKELARKKQSYKFNSNNNQNNENKKKRKRNRQNNGQNNGQIDTLQWQQSQNIPQTHRETQNYQSEAKKQETKVKEVKNGINLEDEFPEMEKGKLKVKEWQAIKKKRNGKDVIDNDTAVNTNNHKINTQQNPLLGLDQNVANKNKNKKNKNKNKNKNQKIGIDDFKKEDEYPAMANDIEQNPLKIENLDCSAILQNNKSKVMKMEDFDYPLIQEYNDKKIDDQAQSKLKQEKKSKKIQEEEFPKMEEGTLDLSYRGFQKVKHKKQKESQQQKKQGRARSPHLNPLLEIDDDELILKELEIQQKIQQEQAKKQQQQQKKKKVDDFPILYSSKVDQTAIGNWDEQSSQDKNQKVIGKKKNKQFMIQGGFH